MGFLPSPLAGRRAEQRRRLCSCSFPGWERSSALRDGSPGHAAGAQRRGQNGSALLLPGGPLVFLLGARQG